VRRCQTLEEGLNVAGSRESSQPGTRDLVEAVMLQVLEFARGAYPVVGG